MAAPDIMEGINSPAGTCSISVSAVRCALCTGELAGLLW
jgi:hypothetical protein